ncbi:MAG: hypothetical protein J6P64_08970 [Bacteroidales bacterium]|nr:hypothetical protein [Bacteroidales bacterium]
MAIVLVEVNRKPQPAGCKCGAQNTTRTATPDTSKVQPVAQMAATMPAATPDRNATTEAVVPKSYMTAFLLMAAFGGVYLISQYNNKK